MSSASSPVLSFSSPTTMSSTSPYGAPEISKGAAAPASSNSPSEKSSIAGTQLTQDQLKQEIENLRQLLERISGDAAKMSAAKDELQNEVSRLTKELQNANSAKDQFLRRMAEAMLENAKLKTKLKDQQLVIENLRTARVNSVSGHSALLSNEAAAQIVEKARGWVP